jgi:hypothetical protein
MIPSHVEALRQLRRDPIFAFGNGPKRFGEVPTKTMEVLVDAGLAHVSYRGISKGEPVWRARITPAGQVALETYELEARAMTGETTT